MEFMNDDTESIQNIDISNSADWMRFNSKEVVVDNDPFSIGEAELKKLMDLVLTLDEKCLESFQKIYWSRRNWNATKFTTTSSYWLCNVRSCATSV